MRINLKKYLIAMIVYIITLIIIVMTTTQLSFYLFTFEITGLLSLIIMMDTESKDI